MKSDLFTSLLTPLRKAQTSPLSLLATGVLVLVLIVVLSSVLPRLELAGGEQTGLVTLLMNTFARPGYSPWASDSAAAARLPRYVMPLFWGALAVAAIYAAVSPAYRKAMLTAVVTILLVAYVLFRIRENQAMQELETTGAMQGLGDMDTGTNLPPMPETPGYIDNAPGWLPWLLAIPIGGLVAGILYGLWLRYRRTDGMRDQMVQQAAAAIEELDAGYDIADTIMRCYISMIRNFEQSRRVRRSAAMTSREFAGHLQKAGLYTVHVEQLSRLFERVRFGEKPSSPREREQAGDCLRRIIADLEGAA